MKENHLWGLKKDLNLSNTQKLVNSWGKLNKLCKERDIYPNISFGKNFVSLSIFLDNEEISEKEKDFSKDIDKFYLED